MIFKKALVFVLAFAAAFQPLAIGGPSSSRILNATQVKNGSGAVNIPSSATVSFPLSVSNGGTGLATLTANSVILGNGASSPLFVAPGASGNGLVSNGTTWTSSPVLANPMTTLGDLLYGGASGAATRLAGDTSNTRKFLREQSTAGTAAAPAWDTLAAGDLPTAAVQTTNSSALNLEALSFTTACGADPCTTSLTKTSGIGTVNWSSAGTYVVHFSGTPYSATPWCTVTAFAGAQNGCNINQISSSQFTVICYNTSSGSLGNNAFLAHCVGAK
jgi:hypothetical protein